MDVLGVSRVIFLLTSKLKCVV